MNLDFVMPEIFKLKNLVRLDLSYNNIVKLSPQIELLENIQMLWLNDNPLREVPEELRIPRRFAFFGYTPPWK